MNNKKIYAIGLFSFGILFNSCTPTENKQGESFDFKIDSINVNHVVAKRNDCRFSTFDFYASLINSTDQSKQLNFTKRENPCERIITGSNLKWVKQEKSKPLVIKLESSSTLFEISANETKRIVLESAFKIEGSSLNQILAKYYDWLKMGKVIYHNNDTVLFKKSTDFKINLYLDDTLITKSDNVRMNKALSKPNTNLNIDSIIGNPPTKEPEL